MVILCHCNQNFKGSFTKKQSKNMAKYKGVVHNAVGSSIYITFSHIKNINTQIRQQ